MQSANGSFKEEWGTAAVITEGNENVRQRITSTSTTPGTAKDQDAYRRNLTVLYHVTSIIEKICEKHNTRSGGIMDAYYGINEIKKYTETNTTYSCQ